MYCIIVLTYVQLFSTTGKLQQTTVHNLAETAAAAANAFLRRTGNDPTEGNQTPNAPPLNLYFNAANYQITVTGATNTITVTDLQHSGVSAARTY